MGVTSLRLMHDHYIENGKKLSSRGHRLYEQEGIKMHAFLCADEGIKRTPLQNGFAEELKRIAGGLSFPEKYEIICE